MSGTPTGDLYYSVLYIGGFRGWHDLCTAFDICQKRI